MSSHPPEHNSDPTDTPTPLFETTVSLAELHDIPNNIIDHVVVSAGRRNDATARRYGGLELIGTQTDISHFPTKDDALAFIDSIHHNGLPYAVREELAVTHNTTPNAYSLQQVIDKFQYGPDGGDNTDSEFTAREYVTVTGISDPLNVFITPIVYSTYRDPTAIDSATGNDDSVSV